MLFAPPPFMYKPPAGASAFPEFVGTAALSNVATTATTHTINLPSGIVSGELLVMLFICDDNPTVTGPSGWTALEASAGSSLRFRLYYRVADGSEGSTATITTSVAKPSAAICVRIQGHNTPTSAPVSANASEASSTSSNPPNLNTGVSRKYLWIAAFGTEAVNGTLATGWAPTNFTEFCPPHASDTTGTRVRCGLAWRQFEGASLDPAATTTGQSANTFSVTAAIYPVP